LSKYFSYLLVKGLAYSVLAATSVVAAPLAAPVKEPPAGLAQTVSPNTGSYQWHGEFVAFEEQTRTLTVKCPAVGESLKQLANFKPGDTILIRWSGFDNYAYAVDEATLFDKGQPAKTRFSFPVQFEALDPTQGYVTFRTKIPSASVPAVEALRPGEWITGVSTHGAASYTQPVASINGFGDDLASS